VDWEAQPPLIIPALPRHAAERPRRHWHLREHFWVTVENRGEWKATKYDAIMIRVVELLDGSGNLRPTTYGGPTK